jgi:hypothetical protein
MENLKIRELTSDVENLTKRNQFNENYRLYYGGPLNTKAIQIDFELLKKYTRAYQKRYLDYQPATGDCLRLPDGQTVYFCHIHEEKGQTCEGGSFHLSESGYISYSGGLDSGIAFSDIELTSERYVLPVWFCHRGYLTGGCGIYANIECRLWKTKEGANLSGIPQVVRLKRKRLKEQSETITKVDGNGRQYKEHLPEIIIKKSSLRNELLEEVERATELKFEESYHFVPVYRCQPMKLKQIEAIRKFPQFKISEERDRTDYLPLLVLQVKG